MGIFGGRDDWHSRGIVMEAFGAGLLIFMMVAFGISALAQAYETSQRHRQDDEE